VWLLGWWVATLAIVVAGTASAALAQTGLPSVSAGDTGPWHTVASGACDPGIEDLCSTVEVAQWPSVPYTPPIACAAPLQCQLEMDISAPTSGAPCP
jgi:hypothetical protein